MSDWQPIETAPKDGTAIRVAYDWDDFAQEDGVFWAETRQCILGARAGERGPGFVSVEAGYLPVEPTHWMALPAPPTRPQALGSALLNDIPTLANQAERTRLLDGG